jgi:hypothetical protein
MVLSLMPGMGQIYVGYYQQGFINILVVASLINLLATGVMWHLHLEALGGIFLSFFWLYNLIDAGRRASYYNQALMGMGPLEIPGDFKLSEGRGSLVGGAVLILIGLVFFAHTRFEIPLDWIEQWWPLAIVLVGAYLLVLAIRDKKEKDKSAKTSK